MIDRFDALIEPPDGEHSERNPSFSDSLFAVKLIEELYQDGIPAPSVAVADGGTFQIEWHRKNYDLEIEILGCNNVIAERLNRITNTTECLEFKNDFSILFSWISDLKGEF